MKLVVGAGDRRVDGAKHHDVQPLSGIDYVCDMWELPQHITKGSLDELHATHVAEHFPMAKVKDLFSLWYGLLGDGGRLYLEVPNFYWHAQEILRNPLDRQIVEYAFGGQHNEWDYHYNGFTPEILAEDLQIAGFRDLDLKPESSICVWATK